MAVLFELSDTLWPGAGVVGRGDELEDCGAGCAGQRQCRRTNMLSFPDASATDKCSSWAFSPPRDGPADMADSTPLTETLPSPSCTTISDLSSLNEG